MLRDWKKISEETYKKNELVKVFHGNSMTEFYQCLYVIKYMIDLGMNQDDILKRFKKIIKKNEITYFAYLGNFYTWYSMANRCKWPKEQDTTFYITKNEIKHINSINAPRDFKLYILGMLAYAKWSKKKCGMAIADKGVRSYMWYIATHEDSYSVTEEYKKNKQIILKKYFRNQNTNHGIKLRTSGSQRTSHGFNKIYTHIVIEGDWIEWNATEGTKIKVLETDVFKLNNRITEHIFIKEYAICSICGKKYAKTAHSKTDLCPECFHNHRNEASKKCMTDSRGGLKGKYEAICPVCGKKFIKSERSQTDLCPECYKIERRKNIAKNNRELYKRKNKKT